MHLDYLLLRTVRHFLPASAARGLLRRGLVIRPGLETSDPQAAVARYVSSLAACGRSLEGRQVMVFGYGGRFGVACGLLARGAGRVVLCDPYAPPDEAHNRALLPEFQTYLLAKNGSVQPRPEFISLLQADIRDERLLRSMAMQDLVLSSSVYEHLDDADGITDALRRWTAPGGAHMHFIDLRDHYFKYPFEMLCYDENAWRRWLNPGSNLNRLRYLEYKGIFERHFNRVEIEVLSRDLPGFERARPRIRPEFLSGDALIDSATSVQVFAEV
jgi:hypothetical protein